MLYRPDEKTLLNNEGHEAHKGQIINLIYLMKL